MLYGHAKRRQMARSLRPSTARRRAAEDLARIRRRSRRQVAQHLAGLTGPAAGAGARWEDSRFDERSWPQRQIKDAVWDRRDHDKVAPFQRWAVAVTRHVQPQDRLDAIRKVLPAGLMGRHALSHLDFLDHFSGHLPPRYWTRLSTTRMAPTLELRAELRAVLAQGRLGEFNRWMKRPEFARGGAEPAWRTLLGEHDIDGFLDDCLQTGIPGSGRVVAALPSAWLVGLRRWAEGQPAGAGTPAHRATAARTSFLRTGLAR